MNRQLTPPPPFKDVPTQTWNTEYLFNNEIEKKFTAQVRSLKECPQYP